MLQTTSKYILKFLDKFFCKKLKGFFSLGFSCRPNFDKQVDSVKVCRQLQIKNVSVYCCAVWHPKLPSPPSTCTEFSASQWWSGACLNLVKQKTLHKRKAADLISVLCLRPSKLRYSSDPCYSEYKRKKQSGKRKSELLILR